MDVFPKLEKYKHAKPETARGLQLHTISYTLEKMQHISAGPMLHSLGTKNLPINLILASSYHVKDRPRPIHWWIPSSTHSEM